MDLRDRVLYHQIHPLKLATDWGTAAIAAWLMWAHELWPALVVGFGPSVIVSWALVRYADLERYRDSAFGRYVARYMTRQVELARFAGLIPLWGGAWLHRPLLIVGGIAWIVLWWVGGIIGTQTASTASRTRRR